MLRQEGFIEFHRSLKNLPNISEYAPLFLVYDSCSSSFVGVPNECSGNFEHVATSVPGKSC